MWKPSWNKKPGEDGENKEEEFPKELEDRFAKSQKDIAAEVDKKIEERFKPMNDFLAEQKAEKDRKEEEEKQRKKNQNNNNNNGNKTQEEINAEFVQKFADDPLGAIRSTMAPVNDAILLTRADNIKREVFIDRAKEFPYYDGSLKKEIDEVLEKQPLSFRNNTQSVENVYYTIVGKHQSEINEGKIKSRFASSSSAISSGNQGKDDEGEKKIKVTPDIERAAKLTGMKTEDYVKLLEKDEEVNV